MSGTARYRLGAGIRLIPRGDDLQIGTAIGRRYLITDAPPRSMEILAGLDGKQDADEVAGSQDDPQWWVATLEELHRAGILQGAERDLPVVEGLLDERAYLTHRHGADPADLALGRRRDSVVEVRGDGRVARLSAELLVGAGVGHVQLTVGSHGDAPLDRTLGVLADLRADGRGLLTTSAGSPTQLRPTVVVLADNPRADSGAVRDLVLEHVPHLAVLARDGRVQIGPLVLPGRSSCLWCLDLHRADRDPDWPLVLLGRGADPGHPSEVLAAGAAALGSAEVLHLLEGISTPLTVDGTVEWDGGQLPRRRSWEPHPACGCRTGPPPDRGRTGNPSTVGAT